jgi:hypothetical protein
MDADRPPPQLDLVAARELREKLGAHPKMDLSPNMERAVAAGKGLSWVASLIKATRSAGKLTVGEYLYYRLYDVPPDGPCRHVGKRMQNKMHLACNDPNWHALCHDKAIFYTALYGAGLPIPETVALFDKRGRRGCFGTVLRSVAELRAFLMDAANYPMFAKPADGVFSIGALHLSSGSGERVTFHYGAEASLDQVFEFIEQLTTEGYLFPKVLEPAHEDVFGSALVAVRLLILMDEEPRLESAVIKIPRSGQIADNFWRGNLLGALRPGDGAIYRVISGYAADLQEFQEHPDTGAALVGWRVEEWPEAVALCTQAARMFPGIRTQSWDVALTADGPVLLGPIDIQDSQTG